MLSTISIKQDIERFADGLINASLEDLVMSFIAILIVGAVMKNRKRFIL